MPRRKNGSIQSFREHVVDSLARIETATKTLADSDKDKEKRIRSLERWRWMHALPLGLVVAGLAKLGIPVGNH